MYKIKWSEVNPPGSKCHYDHVRAETPFGNILMTWKGWKNGISITLDESPWGATGYVGSTVEDAKRTVEEEFNKRLLECLGIEKKAGEPLFYSNYDIHLAFINELNKPNNLK